LLSPAVCAAVRDHQVEATTYEAALSL
jgi:hypothetical protein